MNVDPLQKQIADALLQELSDRGQIVEGGWRAYELLSGLKNTSEVQRNECRKAYFLYGGSGPEGADCSMIHVGSEFRGLCTQCKNPPAYQWHLYGHLVYQCRFGHSWLAWKDVYLTNKNKNTKS